ncbi:MAG: trehalase family glycosidase, partial [Rhodothermales bacterium]
EGAMDSQRVYMERQHDDGYINYRTGSYLNETITTDGERTSSAPWFNWINWELFRVAGDRVFLEEAYASGTAFYEWWMAHRDRDGDGLAEWGGHAVLESVRDSEVAVWDDVGWPDRFEALDLNSMLVAEARSLASMAGALGDTAGAARWTQEAEGRARRIRTLFWDDETGFFYHIDRDDHDFSVDAYGDLKRKEIIGFLPIWAGVSNEEQTERLVRQLTDPSTFWRTYGIPSLAADDPYYDPMGYWNGPVWVEWQYLIFRGLLDQGYRDVAESLADRVIANVAHHLGTDHTFWELYSPDDLQAGHHQTYIWTGLVARMMIDLR